MHGGHFLQTVPLRGLWATKKSPVVRQPSFNSSPVARRVCSADRSAITRKKKTNKKKTNSEPTAPLWMASQVWGERRKKKSPPPSTGLSHCGPGRRPSAENTAQLGPFIYRWHYWAGMWPLIQSLSRSESPVWCGDTTRAHDSLVQSNPIKKEKQSPG